MARPVGEALSKRGGKRGAEAAAETTGGDAEEIRKVTTYATRDDWRRWRAWAVEADSNVSSLVLAAVRLVAADPSLRDQAVNAARRIDEERARGRG